MILPLLTTNRRVMAHLPPMAAKTVECSTNASIVVDAAAREYPRTVSVYTIRTPSPGGQFSAVAPELPAFFVSQSKALEPRGALGVDGASAAKTKGYQLCQLEKSCLRLRPARALRPAATPWVNRRSAARPSVPVQPWSPATAPWRVLPLARRATWPTANSTQAGATDLRSDTSHPDFNAARAAHARRFAWTASSLLCTAKRTPHVQ